jgi:transcriptional regulator with XRE-family HTH domain
MPWQGSPRARTVRGYMPTPKKTAIGARMTRLREEHGTEGKDLTQHDAAALVGVETRQWQRWESGENSPRPPTLEKIARGFGIRVDEFYAPITPGESQLDRIEASLRRLELTLATVPGVGPVPMLEGEIGRDAGDSEPNDPGLEQTGQ